MSRRRTASRGIVLPLAVLALLFALAAMRPSEQHNPAPTVASGSPSTRSNTGQIDYHGPSPGVEILTAILFSVALAGTIWLSFLFVRMVVRRPKKSQWQRHRELPRGIRSDLLMLAMVVALAVAAVVGLRLAFGSGRKYAPLPARPALHLPADRPKTNTALPFIHANRARTPSFERIAAVAAIAGLSLLAFYAARNGDRPMRAHRVPSLVRRPGGREDAASEDMSEGIRRDYAEMCRLASSVVPVRPESTPREYAQEIRRAGVDCAAVHALTLLFELYCYGGREESAATVEIPGSDGEGVLIDSSSTGELLAQVARCFRRDCGGDDCSP